MRKKINSRVLIFHHMKKVCQTKMEGIKDEGCKPEQIWLWGYYKK